jgi:hypothetical protein
MAKLNGSRSLAVTEIRPARFRSPHRRGQVLGGEAGPGSRPPGLGVTGHHSLDEAGGAVPSAELHAGRIAATAGRELSALHSACVISAVGGHVIILADRRTAPHPVHRVIVPSASAARSARAASPPPTPLRRARCAVLLPVHVFRDRRPSTYTSALGDSRERSDQRVPCFQLVPCLYARAKTTPREVACRV